MKYIYLGSSQMVLDRKKPKRNLVKKSIGLGTLQKPHQKHLMEKSRRTSNYPLRTGSKSNPHLQTLLWGAGLLVATHWNWWQLRMRP